MSRLPIRLRLTLLFALVMAVVLAATGFLIYRRVGATLLSSIDQGLRGQAVEAASRAEHGHEVRRPRRARRAVARTGAGCRRDGAGVDAGNPNFCHGPLLTQTSSV